MPLFMASIKLSAESTKAVVEKPQDRRPAARAALEAAGCTLKDYYFALGPADVVVIYEAPDAMTAASMSMTPLEPRAHPRRSKPSSCSRWKKR